jgi:alpha-L-rhamnosidase
MTSSVVNLTTHYAPELLTVGRDPVRLRWRLADGADMAAVDGFEVQASRDLEFAGASFSSCRLAARDGILPFRAVDPLPPLSSREQRFYRVRALDGGGSGEWSEPLRVEAGLLEAADWEALPITLPADQGAYQQSPSPLLRREFEVGAPVVIARLHVTALGLHRVTINGAQVSDDLLAPGWSSYHGRLLSDTYDVTGSIRVGANTIAATLGDGWWRGRLGWEPSGDRCRYGEQIALLAQLELTLTDGSSLTIATDESWSSSVGEVRSADLYDGCSIDLREAQRGWELPGFDDAGWSNAVTVPIDLSIIEPRLASPVRAVKTLKAKATHRQDGKIMLDAGQNIAGYVELTVRGDPGDQITIRHAEVLERDGTLHVRSLRSAKATDSYVLADHEQVVLTPMFTFHGFRYAEVDTTAEVLDATFVALSSARVRKGQLACSDAVLTRFHDNVVWSQLDNFVSLPTDCPQRDERLGWTGDAQAFAPTSLTLFDSVAFWTSWLRDLALDQDPVLGVSTVVPDVVVGGEARYGRAGWSDAATIVPWAVYESDGDPAILEQQLSSMRLHVESLLRRAGADGLLPPAMQFGDWLDPDAPSDMPWMAKADSTFLANAFLVHSARLVSRAALVLGRDSVADEYEGVANRVAASSWERWRDSAVATQTGCAVSIMLGLAPPDERQMVGDALARLVRQAQGRVSTGFLGTPLVLPALSATDHWDEAFMMLLRRDPPSWLYQVEQGATTVWERWDAILPDGSIHDGRMAPMPADADGEDGHMLSFNHYAYGAVIDWVYRHVGGVALDPSSPGYREVIFAPRPALGINWARTSVESPYGRVSIDWKLVGEKLVGDAALPPGTTGRLIAPSQSSSITHVNGELVSAVTELGPGRHSFEVTDPLVVDHLKVSQ